MADTPWPWRAAALGLLSGGLSIGWLAGRSRAARAAVVAASAATLGYVAPIARASRRPPIRSLVDAPAAGETTFSVVVAARDEASVIERLVRDVASQDHRTADARPLFELIVVDDRSIDGTGAAARAAAVAAGIHQVTRIERRSGSGLPDGKGAALTAAQPELCRGDVVVALDADARIGPGFLRTLAGYVAGGADAITARRRIIDAGSSLLARAQADEQTLDGELQRGRWALGGCSEFRGNGIVVRRQLLSAVGGWRAEALTEDLDLSSRLAAAHGVRVAWAVDAEVWEEPVGSWRSLWQQRVRWAEGALRRAFEFGPSVLRSPQLPVKARLDFALYVGQLAMPAVALGALGAAVVRLRFIPVGALVAAYGGSSLTLAFDALRWERSPDGRPLAAGERIGRATLVSLFGVVWVAAVPAACWRMATRRGPVRYDKMAHGRNGPGQATPQPGTGTVPMGDRRAPAEAVAEGVAG
ncbi:MAG TPA: glycosyltransferase family 2 protein [Candidatus Limnocylindrales bacterium]